MAACHHPIRERDMIPSHAETGRWFRRGAVVPFRCAPRRARRRARGHRWAGGLVLAGFLAWVGPTAAGTIVVVANPGLPVETLSADDLRAIYLGKQTFVARMKVNPVKYAGRDAVSESFLRAVVGMSPNQFEAYWVKEVFRSGRLPPRQAVNAGEMVRVVSADPGAIGYVPAEALQGVTSVKRLLSLSVP